MTLTHASAHAVPPSTGGAAAAAATAKEDRKVYYLTDAELASCNSPQFDYTPLPRTKHIHDIDHQMGVFPEAIWLALFPYLGRTALTMRKVSHFFRQEQFELTGKALNIFRNRHLALSDSYSLRMDPLFKAIPDGHCLDVRELVNIKDSACMSAKDLMQLFQQAPALRSIGTTQVNCQEMNYKDFKDFLKMFDAQFPQYMTHFSTHVDRVDDLLLFLEAAQHMKMLEDSSLIAGLEDELAPDSLLELEYLKCIFNTGADFTTMMAAAPNLKTLKLARPSPCDGGENIFLAMEAGSLPNLTGLSLAINIDPRIILSALDVAPNIDALELKTDCSGYIFNNTTEESGGLVLRTGGLHHVLKDKAGAYPNIKVVKEAGYQGALISRDVVSIFNAMPNLRQAYFSMKNKRVNLPAIPVTSLTHLEQIGLKESLVRRSDIEALIANAPELKKINVMDCTLLGQETIRLLRGKYPHITFVSEH